jgi:cupin fold WbuC family metalloprotein
VEGESRVILFNDNGSVERMYDMGSPGSGKPFISRNSTSIWYSYIPLTEFLVVHEILQGPFDSSNTEYPEWGPEEPELAGFLRKAAGLES